MLAKVVLENGGNITGFWPIKGYDFTESKALYNAEFFYGLAIDEDNQPELTQERVMDWLSILKDEFSVILN
jgi:flavodoxin I